MKEELLILISTPLYFLVIGAEILFSHIHVRKYYTLKGTLMNIYLCLVNSGIDLLFRLVYVFILLKCFSYRFIDLSGHPVIYWLFLFLLEDLVFYVEHRIDHYCRLFWAVHVTHHSSEEFNLTIGFRSSVFQPLYRFLYFIPLVFLGFHPADIVFMYSLTQIYGILVHTQYIKQMPEWFESIFVSPSHHRVHHASNIRYLDKNMGMVLIIWDRLFSTFQAEVADDPIKYGLVKAVQHPHRLSHIMFHEWNNMGKDLGQKLPLSVKLKYLFMPPGWSHDGRSKTATQLRKEFLIAEKEPNQELQQSLVPS